MHGLIDEAVIAAADREKLQNVTHADRRMREQHKGLLAAVKGLKAQADTDGAALAAAKQQIDSFQAKVLRSVSASWHIC